MNKKLMTHILFNETSEIFKGWLVEVTDSYIHIIDMDDYKQSYMLPWNRIHEIHYTEIEFDDDQQTEA